MIELVSVPVEFVERAKALGLHLDGDKVEQAPATLGMRLGDRLRAQDAERARLGSLAVAERDARTKAEFAENEGKLRRLIGRAVTEIEQAVQFDRKPKPVRMEGYGLPWRSGSKPPSDSSHAYNHIFREYAEWGASQDLELKFIWQHDGAGMSDWFDVVFVPIQS